MRKPLFRVAVYFIVALAIRIFVVAIWHYRPWAASADLGEYEALALAWSAGNPNIAPSGFVRSPLYPMFLALIFKLFGAGDYWALGIAQAVAGAMAVSLIGYCALRLAGKLSGDIAAAAAAFYPFFLYYVPGIASEAIYLLLSSAFLVALLLVVRTNSITIYHWLGVGVLGGLAALCKATILPILTLVGLVLGIFSHGLSTRLSRFILFTAGVLLPLFPWGLYNLTKGNGFVLSSSGGGVNFYLNNGPEAYDLYVVKGSGEAFASTSRFFFEQNMKKFQQDIKGLTIQEREHFFYKKAFNYIKEHPLRWFAVMAVKLREALRPWLRREFYGLWPSVASGALFMLLVIGAIAGFWHSLGTMEFRLSLTICLGYVIISTVFVPMIRYRFVIIDPLLIIWFAIGPIPYVMSNTIRYLLPKGTFLGMRFRQS